MRRGDSRQRRYSQGAVWIRRAGQERRRASYLSLQRRELALFVLAVFAKNEKADLSLAERNALAKMVADMIESNRRQK